MTKYMQHKIISQVLQEKENHELVTNTLCQIRKDVRPQMIL